jgi:hypothetical protein
MRGEFILPPRLPSIAELLSLVDTTQSNPALPLVHPFSGLQSIYWSSPQFKISLPLSGEYISKPV